LPPASSSSARSGARTLAGAILPGSRKQNAAPSATIVAWIASASDAPISSALRASSIPIPCARN